MAKSTMVLTPVVVEQELVVEWWKYSELGAERNIQNEFDHRFESLFTARVVMRPISTEDLWGLTGWDPTKSFEIHLVGGALHCYPGAAYVGASRYIRTSDGDIALTPGDGYYAIRVKFTASTGIHAFVAETWGSESPDTKTDKYMTLAKARRVGGSWTELNADLRTSLTAMQPPVTFSGDAGSNPVLTLQQDGSGLALLAKGGDTQVGEAGGAQQLLVYGSDTLGITIINGANSVEMICSAVDTMKVQTSTGGDAVLSAATLAIPSGATLNAAGLNMNSDPITGAASINGLVIAAGAITTGEWQGTAIASAYLGAHYHDGNTLQLDGVNSNGGAFAFSTTGQVTFNQNVSVANLITTGNVDGVDVSALKTDVDGFHDDLKNLTATEIAELEKIGSTTISAAQWGYLGALDQGLTQASNPTFANLIVSRLTSTGIIEATGGAGVSYYQLGSSMYTRWINEGNESFVMHWGGYHIIIDADDTESDRQFTVRKDDNTYGGSTVLFQIREDAAVFFYGDIRLDNYSGFHAGHAYPRNTNELDLGTDTNKWRHCKLSGVITTAGGNPNIFDGYVVIGSDAGIPPAGKISIGESGDSFMIKQASGEWIKIKPDTDISNGNYFTSGQGMWIFDNALYLDKSSKGLQWTNVAGTGQMGNIGTTARWAGHIYCEQLHYKTACAYFADHLDDLAIIDSMKPIDIKTRKPITIPRDNKYDMDISGLPKYVHDEDGFFSIAGMDMLLAGGIKQLHRMYKEQQGLIASLMGEIEELKKEAAS